MIMPLNIAGFDAITFDVYGTLIDWEPSIRKFLKNWAERSGIKADEEELLMAFDRARADIQKERPALLYPNVLRRCFERLCVEYRVIADFPTREEFASTPGTWPAYPDTHEGLKKLQSRAMIGAFSNIDNASLAASCRNMDITFDIVVTAERVGAYKPDHTHFHTGIADIESMGIPRSRILHVGQSLRADITPANKLGLPCVWIHRPGRLLGLSGEGAAEARPNLEVQSLAELVEHLFA
jgi:2-haloacid dehalogenase